MRSPVSISYTVDLDMNSANTIERLAYQPEVVFLSLIYSQYLGMLVAGV